MKTNLHKQTKYFRNIYNSEICKFELEEIPLNRDNWWYVQLDSTIRYAFLKYNLQLPKYVVLDELKHRITINIFRSPIKNTKELLQWKEKFIYLLDELKLQAESNSDEFDDEHWIIYEFKLM